MVGVIFGIWLFIIAVSVVMIVVSLVMVAMRTFWVSTIALGAMLAFALYQSDKVGSHTELTRVMHLARIERDPGASGNFFLGFGTVQGAQYYFYYAKNQDGSMSPGRIYADGSVRILETDGYTADLMVYSTVRNNSPHDPILSHVMDSSPFAETDRPVEFYEFRVPKGTVKTGFGM